MKTISRFISIYIVPGAIYQSIAIGGGYGTGREIVQYFTQYGVTGGGLAIGLAVICMAVVVAVTFEFARLFRVYDYRSYMDHLLGPVSVIFEILAITMLLLVLAVVGASAGRVLFETFGTPVWSGTLLMFVLVMTLNYLGREVITKVLTWWSVVLYAVFIAYFVVTLSRYSGGFTESLKLAEIRPGWAQSGFKYAFYNLAPVPVILYAVRSIETRKQALISGCLAAVITMVPGLLFHLSFAPTYPAILGQPLPTYWMMHQLSIPLLTVLYVIVLFGTLVETCAGGMQGVNERLDHWSLANHGEGLSRLSHALTAGVAILVSGSLSMFGIIALVAKGYGTIAWGFFVIYVVPTLTIGVYKISRQQK